MGPKQRNMKVGGLSKYQCEVNFWNREKCLKYPRVKHFPRVEGGNIRKKKNKQNITRIQPPAMGQRDSTVWEYKILELFVRAVPTFLPTYNVCPFLFIEKPQAINCTKDTYFVL